MNKDINKEWKILYKKYIIEIKLQPTYPSNHKTAMYSWLILNGKRIIEFGNDYYEDITKEELIKQLKENINQFHLEIANLITGSLEKIKEIKVHFKQKDYSDRLKLYNLYSELHDILSELEGYYGSVLWILKD